MRQIAPRREGVGQRGVDRRAIGKTNLQPRELETAGREGLFVDLDAQGAPRLREHRSGELLHRESGPSVLLLEVLLREDQALMPERFVYPHTCGLRLVVVISGRILMTDP